MFDVIVVGGSYAGLAAALQLGRARRTVLVVDAGQKRNRFSHASHGFLGQDGVAPEVLGAKGRAEVLAYPTVRWRDGEVTRVEKAPEGFLVTIGSEQLVARRLVLATGVVDELPTVPGLAERWGQTVFPCPYCDGYELNQGPLGVLAAGPMSIHQALLVAEWTTPGRTTFFLNGLFEPDTEQRTELEARGIRTEAESVAGLEDNAPSLSVRLRDGRAVELAGLFIATRSSLAGPFAEQLGCELEKGPTGPYYKTDFMKQTTVPGVWACGDSASMVPALSFAVADGVRAGIAAHQSLVFTPEQLQKLMAKVTARS